MVKLIWLRTALVVPLLFAVATAAFFLASLSDADPARIAAGQNASPDAIHALRVEMGLDGSTWHRYVEWLSGAVRGDLGASVYNKAPVAESIKQAMPITLSLTLGGLIVGVSLGVTAGVVSALKAGRPADRVLSTIATLGQSIPGFWLALLLTFLFALRWRWLPATGFVGPTTSITEWLRTITLPCLSIGLVSAASIARQTRSAMIGVLQQEYVRAAAAHGLSRRRVLLKHALKNAAAPVVTVLSFQVTSLLGGSIVVERLFNLRGLGAVAIDAVLRRDPDVIQGVVVCSVAAVFLVNLALDILYAWLNPRVRPA